MFEFGAMLCFFSLLFSLLIGIIISWDNKRNYTLFLFALSFALLLVGLGIMLFVSKNINL